MGGPNLLRSPVMLNDVNGERLLPIVRGSRANAGMPAIELSEADAKAVALYVHSVLATARAQGAPPPGDVPALNVLVGDAAAGELYFKEKCVSCHSRRVIWRASPPGCRIPFNCRTSGSPADAATGTTRQTIRRTAVT